MALLKTGSYKNTGTVYLDYKLYADQIGGSGNNRTIRVTVEFKCGGNPSYPSWYGYPCYWQPYVNSTYGSTGTMKGSESWNTNNGYRSYSQDITVNVGTTSSTSVTVGFITNSTGDDGWDGGASASLGVSSTNTPPVVSGSVTADDTTGNKYIPENQGSVALSWPAASDANGNLAGYRVRVSINGGGYSEIARTNTSTRSYTHNISGYGVGTSFKYAVDAYDYESAWSSGSMLSGVLTKNTMTKATLVAPASIVYNTTSLSFSWSGASNQVSNSSFSYKLTCDNINLYDAFSTGGSITVAIVTSKPASGAYILQSDLINYVKNSNYKGTLNFRLTTSNAYGSSASDIKSTSVNLQSPPATPKPVINTADDSPDSLNIWRTAADTKNRYMIPDGVRRIRVSWPAITGLYGESISYDVFYRLDGGGYISLGNQNGTTYNLVLPYQEKMTTINFMVRAKSSYGLVSADGVSLGQNLHYYKTPYIIFGKYVRTDTTATVQVRVLSESSIPNINTKGTYRNTTLGTAAVALPLSQTDLATLTFTGLSSKNTYDITFVYNDGTGFTPNNFTHVYKIGPNLPAFFFNKYGIGAGGLKADANAALRVNGGGYINGLFSVEGNLNSTGNLNGGSGTIIDTFNIGSTLTVKGTSKLQAGLELRGLGSGDGAEIMSIERSNGTQAGYMDLETNGEGLALHTYTTGGAWDGQFRFLPKSVFEATQFNGSAYNFVGYKNWDSGGFASTGGGAAIVNDNGSYKALMILGNSSGGGTRKIGLWDDVNVVGKLSVGDNPIVDIKTEVTATMNKQSIHLYDGTAIETCATKLSSMTLSTAAGAIYHSPQYTLGAWLRPFVDYPAISMVVSNTANFWYTGNQGETPIYSGKITFFGAGSGTWNLSFWIHVTGIGRWK